MTGRWRVAGMAMRWLIEAILVWQAWLHVHWTVAFLLTLLTINAELHNLALYGKR